MTNDCCLTISGSDSVYLDSPDTGAYKEVAPGIMWVRLPLPYQLDHINVWLIKDGDKWALVDTGVFTTETMAIWDRLLSSRPFDRQISRVIVTHMHPDHIGLAGWFARHFGAELWISPVEYLTCMALLSGEKNNPSNHILGFYRRAGWEGGALRKLLDTIIDFGKFIHPLPESFVRLEHAQSVKIGEYFWVIVAGGGHSPEHLCLYCPELKVLITGDQVLPEISSNISVNPMEPSGNPMAKWFTALDLLRSSIPNDVLVLPSHHRCFRGLHNRIDELLEKQNVTLSNAKKFLSARSRVIDLFSTLFVRKIDISFGDPLTNLMATGEAMACLNYLLCSGEVTRDVCDEVAWYTCT